MRHLSGLAKGWIYLSICAVGLALLVWLIERMPQEKPEPLQPSVEEKVAHGEENLYGPHVSEPVISEPPLPAIPTDNVEKDQPLEIANEPDQISPIADKPQNDFHSVAPPQSHAEGPQIKNAELTESEPSEEALPAVVASPPVQNEALKLTYGTCAPIKETPKEILANKHEQLNLIVEEPVIVHAIANGEIVAINEDPVMGKSIYVYNRIDQTCVTYGGLTGELLNIGDTLTCGQEINRSPSPWLELRRLEAGQKWYQGKRVPLYHLDEPGVRY